MSIIEYFIIGATGLAIGSFLNVLIYRLPIMLGVNAPRKFNLFVPRSHCPCCQKNIKWWQNVPVVSFAVLRGRCANCSSKISWHYPLVEIIACVSGVIIWHSFEDNYFEVSAKLFFTACLIALSFIDYKKLILPDQITLSLLWAGLLMSLYLPGAPLPKDAILGAVAGYLSLWCIAKLFELVSSKVGLGHGDFKLFAALGAWLGWSKLPLLLFLAALCGSIIGVILIASKAQSLNSKIPFGPFLAVVGWILLIFGPF